MIQLEPGHTLSGRYLLREQLGRGGMAEVYAAYDQTLNLDVALKILPSRLAADPGFVARFRREGQMLARLTHPNLLRLYDVAHDEALNLYFLVLEYLTGGTLQDRLDEEPMDTAEVLKILRPVAAALDFAHHQNPPVLHGDIKPSNLMFDSSGRVVVTDFGLARIIAPETVDPTAWNQMATMAGPMSTWSLQFESQSLGTAPYMAAEQANGEVATAASDRYALGVVAYQMLVGAVPFLAPTRQATLIQVARDPVPRPSQRNPRIEPHVERALLKVLDRDPAQRHQSCEAFITDLASADFPTIVTTAYTPPLDVQGEPAGAEVLLDGQPIGRLPCRVPVQAHGSHVLTVRAKGYEEARLTVELPPRAPLLIRLEPERVAPLSGGLGRPRRDRRPVVTLFAVGVAAALVGGTGIMYANAVGGRTAAPPVEPTATVVATEAPTLPAVPTTVPSKPAIAPSASPAPAFSPSPITSPAPTRTVDEEWRAVEASLESTWGRDWPAVISAIDAFRSGRESYQPAKDKLYSACVEFGKKLLAEGLSVEGVAYLVRANDLIPERGEARAALLALTPTATTVPTLAPTLPPAVPTRAPTYPGTAPTWTPTVPATPAPPRPTPTAGATRVVPTVAPTTAPTLRPVSTPTRAIITRP